MVIGNLQDYQELSYIPDLTFVDELMMSKMYTYLNNITSHYENMDTKAAYEEMFRFFHEDLYHFYIETIKHTLTTNWASQDFLSHQYVLRCLLDC